MTFNELKNELANNQIGERFYESIVHDFVLAASFEIRAKEIKSFNRKVECYDKSKAIRDTHLKSHQLFFGEVKRLVEETAKHKKLDPVRDWVKIANILV